MVKTRLLFAAALFGAVVAGSLGAQTVAEDVVRGQEIQGIEFKNYVGPHKVIETRQAIQGIGADLGRQIAVLGATSADYAGKYSVLRLHDPTSELLSADLLILGPGAGVDHIRNLNWILSAYLQRAFGYSAADADLLANFVTRYNAFYRGNLAYLRAQYIPSVANNVTAENAGLALSYLDWPGKTRIFIPLRDSLSKGLGGSLNTEEISNQDIVTQMAQEPGAGIEERKKLADLKETEIVQEQKAIAQAETKASVAPTTPGTTPASPTTTPPGTPALAATATDTKAATKAEAKTETKTETPPSSQPAAATLPLEQAKKDLAERDAALQTERQDIVQQETKTPTTTPAPAPAAASKPAATAAFVRMSETTKTGQLWLIDASKNTVWRKSELNTIRHAAVQTLGTGLLAVAGDTRGANAAVRLVLLSKDDASVLITGTDDVHPDASVLVQGNQVLALTKDAQGNWVLGLFDASLKLVTKGSDALSGLTAFVPTGQGLLVQSASGPVILVDATTLKKKTNTEG